MLFERKKKLKKQKMLFEARHGGRTPLIPVLQYSGGRGRISLRLVWAT
jgi:hypothetical protein